MNKKRIISGLTATGSLTIGNYFGALKTLIEYQNNDEYEVFLFVADLSALTMPNRNENKENLLELTKQNLKLYIACGIDPKKVNLFIQSHIPEHLELFYFIMVNSTQGELERMTQYKAKKNEEKMKINANGTITAPIGVLMYPILMISDILLYDADFVFVGNDQKQHLELARDLAERMNKNFDLNFTIPEPKIPLQGGKIFSLSEPNKKMSKSSNDDGTIYLLDDPQQVAKKIAKAITDSENKIYFDENKPGVSNLLTIYSLLKKIPIDLVSKNFDGKTYKNLKDEVTKELLIFLNNIQKKYNSISDEDIEQILNEKFDLIKNIAKTKIKIVKEKMGLLSKNERKE